MSKPTTMDIKFEKTREQVRRELLKRWEAYREAGATIDEETMDRWLSRLAEGAVELRPRSD